MYTNVQKIYTTEPRRTEHAEARHHLERHDANQQGRKRKQHHNNDGSTHANATIISVRALLRFLDNTIDTNRGPLTGAHAPQDYNIQAEMDLGQNAAPRTISAQAARAAALYQSTSRAKANTVLLETTDQASIGPEIDLSAADMRTISRLRQDLTQLSAHNIETLEIHPAASFLASLENAITAALPRRHHASA